MTQCADLLIELGTEELPPRALPELEAAFASEIDKGLEAAGLGHQGLESFATPRRLAVLLRQVPAEQASRTVERRGPAVAAAFDDAGKPTPAALGFARSCGVEMADLQTLETDKGHWLVHRQMQLGSALAKLLPDIVATALAALPIPKRMRWGNNDAEFVRPVHWLVLLYGDQVIDADIMGISAGRETRGHRFHCPEPLQINEPSGYAGMLQRQGWVIPQFSERREQVRQQVMQAAAALGGQAIIEEELLAEVTALVEWPVPITGHFDARFLSVPQEALMSTMQDNQKYFPVIDTDGVLMPHFITIANIDSQSPERVQEGNERVIRPRFADAEFFWTQDRRQTLESHLPGLKTVIFQQRLGSLFDKTQRITAMAEWLAPQIGADREQAKRAAQLCKCDLQTLMVYEFTELQGIMGRYYAAHDGETKAVAQALEEQYFPRQAGDKLPTSAEGQTLALADRLDTLVGIFAIGQKPSGTKDPFALRRAALGVLRILIESQLPLDLQTLLQQAAKAYPAAVPAEKAVPEVLDYMLERLRAYYADQGVIPEIFESVLALRPLKPLDFDARVHAVAHFRELPEAEALAAAHKRIHNILRKQEVDTEAAIVDGELLSEVAELSLFNALEELQPRIGALFDQADYTAGLTALAALRGPVDTFFEQVMVMAEDPKTRANRLALLGQVSRLLIRVADLSRLP
ncbi:glycyl-tRNA synthetase beta chain [Ectothiorhodosinus mongolicus]|uniref:Glycine--tRNA ligase beta subunit n=1 Tax=Ectothiorhodosinus mongolicus TaxID=233100 RepID=A0A1R3VXV0_9GAMM|nr:glycine--tRNA ligase subunit beta [Ectothiorhodosinus mongolicus]ULX57094.1 glycine--tRNA ligase subunit beta [Ectothiorhodosinus mongolicus]SIT69886.1 glycyl-tRNA synthetase beta chain [Ectothiorhodosinus mongolicus]